MNIILWFIYGCLHFFKNGIEPSNPRRGYIIDYALKIGNRVSLIPFKNEKSYGIVMTVDDDVIHNLYAENSVADYVPEEVNNITVTNDSVRATCYNLPSESLKVISSIDIRANKKDAENCSIIQMKLLVMDLK